MSYNSSFVIPKTAILETAADYAPSAITTNSADLFSKNGTSAKNITSISLSEIKFTVTDPQNENFDFMESIEIYIKADGLDERLISTDMSIPETQLTSITGALPDVNLVEYLSKDHYTLRFKIITDQGIPSDFTLNASQTFVVDAKKN